MGKTTRHGPYTIFGKYRIVECLLLNRYVLNFNTNLQTVIYRNEISV